MTITNMEEYKTPLDETISIQFSVEGGCWEVTCWDNEDRCRWYKEYDNETAARKEYNRWKLNQ